MSDSFGNLSQEVLGLQAEIKDTQETKQAVQDNLNVLEDNLQSIDDNLEDSQTQAQKILAAMQDLKKECFKESEETRMAIAKQNVWLDKLSARKDNMETFPYIPPPLFRDALQGSASKPYSMKSARSDPNIVARAKEFAKAKLPPGVQVYYGTEAIEDDEFEDYEEEENYWYYGEEEGVTLPERPEESADIIMADIIQQEDDKLEKLLAKEGINEEALFLRLRERNQKQRQPAKRLTDEQKKLTSIQLYCQLKAERQKARGDPVKITSWDEEPLPELTDLEKEMTIPQILRIFSTQKNFLWA